MSAKNMWNSFSSTVLEPRVVLESRKILQGTVLVWRLRLSGAYRLTTEADQYSIIVPDKNAVVTVTAHK